MTCRNGAMLQEDGIVLTIARWLRDIGRVGCFLLGAIVAVEDDPAITTRGRLPVYRQGH